MRRLSQLIAIALLVSALACSVDGTSSYRPSDGGTAGSGKRDSSGNIGTGAPASGSAGSAVIGNPGGTAGRGGAVPGSGGNPGATGITSGTAAGTVTTGGMDSGSGSGGANSGAAGGPGNGGSGSGGANSGAAGGPGNGGAGTISSGAGTGGGSTSGAGGTNVAGGNNAAGGRSASGGASGAGGSSGQNCTICHGDSVTNNPAPPSDTEGNAETSFAGVGAHAKHLATSSWHRQGKCTDCHAVPTSSAHSNSKVDFTWGAPSNLDNAKPAVNITDPKAPTCSDVYCHGTTLAGASSAKTTPVWTQVDESWSACGSACHATPPAASTGHPNSTACEKCHSKVIASFAANSPSTTWKDPTLHINGTVEVDTLTCTSCHGSGTNPAPPKDTQGNTATTAAGVGAHAQHLGTSTWHRQGQCADCHNTPTSTSHTNNNVDFTWAAPSNASGAAPSFNVTDLSCSGTYCHGAKMTAQSSSVGRVPVWNKVDGTHDACGKACHANPPISGSHSASVTACQNCHSDVISSYNGASSTWKNASLHINGKVEATAQTCSSCHGDPPNGGTHTRRQHQVACTNCHPNPNGSTHRNGTVNNTCGSGQNGCHDEGD